MGLGGPPPLMTPGLGAPPVAAPPPLPPPVAKKPAAVASPPPAAEKPVVVASPPPSVSPSLPPAAPGLMVAQRVKTEFVLAGTVETFDRDGFKRALLAVFTDALDVTLTVSAASIRVVSAMDFASPTAAAAAAKTIDTTPVAEMQSAWFEPNGMSVTIENTPAASVSSVVIDPTTVANPAALPSSVAAKLQPQPNAAGIVVGVLFGFIFLVGAAVFAVRRKRLSKLFPSGYKVSAPTRGATARKTRVIPEVGIVGGIRRVVTPEAGAGAPPIPEELAGTAPLMASGASGSGPPLAVAEAAGAAAAVPVAVKGQKMPSLLGGRKGPGATPLAVPLATASEQGYKLPPLSPQHRAEAAEEEKKRLALEEGMEPPMPSMAESAREADGKDEARDDRSETSATQSESASTAMVTGGAGGGPAAAATRFEMMDQQMAMGSAMDPASAAIATPAGLPPLPALPPIASSGAAPPLPPIDPADKR